ncbi:MAG: YicC family protein [Clostridia bacterium]|nr:YicC family protein [Clostridia bacterium]
MIRSMTGFGRAEATVSGKLITVELKSVNHRYFEFNCRTSRGYAFLEEKLKSYLSTRVSRGKIDMFVSITSVEDSDVEVVVNHSLASAYTKAFTELADTYKVENDLTASVLSRIPDVLTVHKVQEDESEIYNIVLPVVSQAVDKFVAMREVEGQRLSDDVMSRAKTILDIVSLIEARSPETVKEYEKRLYDRISELLESATVDEQRILTEAAVFADKVAVAEETVRLRSHFDQMESIMRSNEAVGRKLDFIMQEMNREANTIGSKVTDAELAHRVVDIKAELEKIREQIQNIE